MTMFLSSSAEPLAEIYNFLEFFWKYLPDLLRGSVVTLELSLVGLLVGFILGMLSAVLRIYGNKPLRWLSVGYIELFRGTPLLVQLFLIYYGLPSLGITFDRMTAAFIALGLNSGAYQAEYLRGAILAIGSGQMMAGRAIGLSRVKTIVHIILPQALRLAIPSWANEPISLLKTTAVVFLIAVPDLMTRAKAAAAQTYDPISAYFAAAILYLLMVFILNELLKLLERKVRIPGFEMESKKA